MHPDLLSPIIISGFSNSSSAAGKSVNNFLQYASLFMLNIPTITPKNERDWELYFWILFKISNIFCLIKKNCVFDARLGYIVIYLNNMFAYKKV